ncbi:MAG: hypothetical protein U0V18_13700 [Anaerolineales bacterium]
MSTPKEQKVALRCFAYPGKNGDQQGYYAVCIDLNLHTWRPTFKEARQSLNDAIHGYVEAALDLSKDEELTQKKIESLLHRPAPFFPYQAKYYYHRIKHAMLSEIRTAYSYSEGAAYKNPVEILPNGTILA